MDCLHNAMYSAAGTVTAFCSHCQRWKCLNKRWAVA